jgi:hypothetical protein
VVFAARQRARRVYRLRRRVGDGNFAIAARPAILAQAVLRAHVHKTISGNIWQVDKADNAHDEADNHAHHAKRPQAAAVFC